MKSWKTTVAAIAMGVVTVLGLMGIITPEQSTALLGVLGAFGLAAAKDHNVSGK